MRYPGGASCREKKHSGVSAISISPPRHSDSPDTGGQKYLEILTKALKAVHRFEPRYLVVCLGLDTAEGADLELNKYESSSAEIQ